MIHPRKIEQCEHCSPKKDTKNILVEETLPKSIGLFWQRETLFPGDVPTCAHSQLLGTCFLLEMCFGWWFVILVINHVSFGYRSWRTCLYWLLCLWDGLEARFFGFVVVVL